MTELLTREKVEQACAKLQDLYPHLKNIQLILDGDAGLRRRLAAMTAERDAFIHGGVTEALLRKQDGCIKLGKGCCIVIEQEWDETIYRLNVLEPERTACQARAAAAEQQLNEALGALGYPVPGDTPQGRYKCGLCEATQGLLAAAINDRDAWNGDANSHLQALCEKQAEVNGLEQGLAAAYLEVLHYREACASVGETDGHGWAETTKELRQRLAEAQAEIAHLNTAHKDLRSTLDEHNISDVSMGWEG